MFLNRRTLSVACVGLALGATVLGWAQTPPATPAKDEFAPPSFVVEERASAASAAALASNTDTAAAPEIGADSTAEVAPNEGTFTNKIEVGDIIVTPHQKLYRQSVADIRFEEVPVRDALRYLAEAAGINYVLPDIETDKITINMRMPPFKAMEVLADNFGLGLYDENDLWFIRKKDKAQYFAKIYKIKNIHLGASTSGTGINNSDDNNNTTTNSNGTTTNNGTTTGTSTTSGTTSTSGTTTSSSGTATVATDGGGGVVMTTLQQILGIDAAFGGTLGADGKSTSGSSSSTTSTSSSTSATSENKTSDYTYVSYDADANTLFIIATATQHSWVEQYINAIDNPTQNIAIEAMFLESSRNPTEVMGFDWEGASSMTLKTTGQIAGDSTSAAGSTLNFGTISNPKFPWKGLITSNTFSMGVRAFEKQTDSQIARYPSVVTQNGREVKIQTTQKIPLSALERVTSTDTSTVVGIKDLGTQDIGTTITITPRQINEKLIQLKVSISISTAAAGTDSNTNRVATNETTYDGVVNVPVGYTLAIGGLERVQDDVSLKGVPGLGKIPLFGFLFKDSGKTFTRSNVFLFITPSVLATEKPDNAFLRQSEGLSRDWVDKADAQHRAWRRNSVDPKVDEVLKDANKKQ